MRCKGSQGSTGVRGSTVVKPAVGELLHELVGQRPPGGEHLVRVRSSTRLVRARVRVRVRVGVRVRVRVGVRVRARVGARVRVRVRVRVSSAHGSPRGRGG